jgi:hypothetical protein
MIFVLSSKYPWDRMKELRNTLPWKIIGNHNYFYLNIQELMFYLMANQMKTL